MKTEISKFRKIKRKPIAASRQELITTEYLDNDKQFPLVIQPAVKGLNLISWSINNREFIEQQLLQHGAILFRNCQIDSPAKFREFISASCDEALEYSYRSSPRTEVGDRIYTSTDYPADRSIFPHNENSYAATFPLRILFFCLTPAAIGGETPIGRCRNILKYIDRQIIEKFQQKQIMYVRNFGNGFGLSWQTVFQTTDKQKVAEYCRHNNIQWEWRKGDRLRTKQIQPAIVLHPQTKEKVWFNHAAFFHISTLEPQIRQALITEFKEEDFPNNTYYGDGSPLEEGVLNCLRYAYQQEMVTCSWQKGDVLLLDNMLVAHARNPYQGCRKVLVGMAQEISHQDVLI